MNRTNLVSFGRKAGVTAFALMASGAAFAQSTLDLSAIDDARDDITAVGVAVFGVYVLLKVYKWIRRSL
ncbi:MAG: phage coat protein [Rhodospirillaceae bacterium]|nr:phage coat protein [Rhodospirillaceae bacterium]